MAMVIKHISEAEINCRCVVCNKTSNDKTIFRDRGIEVSIPICFKCTRVASPLFNENLKEIVSSRITQMKNDVLCERELTFSKK